MLRSPPATRTDTVPRCQAEALGTPCTPSGERASAGLPRIARIVALWTLVESPAFIPVARTSPTPWRRLMRCIVLPVFKKLNPMRRVRSLLNSEILDIHGNKLVRTSCRQNLTSALQIYHSHPLFICYNNKTITPLSQAGQ